MTSPHDARLGESRPTIQHSPPGVVSLAAAEEAIELADAYGVCDGHPLAESQKTTIRTAGGERADGSWAATRIADFGPRQGTGKNDKIAAWELAHLLLFGTELIIHTAHEFPTANESFLRLVAVFDAWDELRKKVSRIRYANGEQGIELRSGQRLKYRARTGGSGRGFAKAGLIIYDEAQHLGREHVAASGPAKLANPNSQTWYAGSGGLAHSAVAWEIRRAALLGTGGRLAYTEMTGETVTVKGNKIQTVAPDPADREVWYRCIPGLGRWVTEESVKALFDELGPVLFAREILCVWDPEPSADQPDAKFDPAKWEKSRIPKPPPVADGDLVLAYDVHNGWASVSLASGTLSDSYGECIQHRAGAGWIPDYLVDVAKRRRPWAIGLDGGNGEAVALLGAVREAFEDAGLDQDLVKPLTSAAYRAACGAAWQAVEDGKASRPRLTPDQLHAAGEVAAAREIGESWVWDRSSATVPLSPLVSWTIARHLLGADRPAPPRIFAY